MNWRKILHVAFQCATLIPYIVCEAAGEFAEYLLKLNRNIDNWANPDRVRLPRSCEHCHMPTFADVHSTCPNGTRVGEFSAPEVIKIDTDD